MIARDLRHHPFRIGLALGSGSARGWAHIGVIRALAQAGIEPDIVCGTSIGALVGATYAAGELDWLESWVTSLSWRAVVSLLDVSMAGGLIKGERVLGFFRPRLGERRIDELDVLFGAVATELQTGREVWLREGRVLDAVRASMAVPGLFRPALREGRLLVDGALVNPVPVSLCRAMGADIVIAVDLNFDLMGQRFRVPRLPAPAAPPATPPANASLLDRLSSGWERLKSAAGSGNGNGGNGAGGGTAAADAADPNLPVPNLPSVLEVLTSSLNIMQVRITSSRLAGEPADVMIRPRLAAIAQMDYHRATTAIAEGRRAAELAIPAVHELLGTTPDKV